ncbi:OstA-like protein [Nibrella saemangeumensis]|uniref:OstA-like protein n=1 Tax=Nibrella saemangeumensis TaxID=1084526 RepID=A0ABP8MVI0_9BACT
MRCNPFHFYRVFLILLLLGSLSGYDRAWGQTGRPSSAASEKVELLPPGADSLVVINQPNMVVRKLFNNVRFRHKGVLMYCNLAIQNVTTNVIEAYGNVRIIQGDTISVRSDTMFYYGNTRIANMRGNVVLKDRKMTLSTSQLDYDMANGLAVYPNPGRIVDRENVLTSKQGYYDTRTKQFTFRQNVKLVNPKYTLTADSLLYNSLTKIATFQGPTKIVSKDGTLLAREGQYNTVTRVSNFQRRATVETDKYTLTGDTLDFDNATEIGVAKGNVVMVAKSDKTILTGDQGRYNGKAGVSRLTGYALVKSTINQDTLFMRADTLFSFDNKEKKTRKLVGQKNVIVYKSDLQSRCDSLVYDVADSTIYFYKKPIVWSENYQMEADSITAKLKNNHLHTMLLRSKSFVISQDTLRNFNQVKGRTITAYFQQLPDKANPKESKTSLDRVIVEGNGQSIYFAMDDKNRMVGMNHVECSKMNLEFKESKVDRIRFYGRPDAAFVPPHELTDSKKQLDGFRWRKDEKPTKAQTLGQAEKPAEEPKPKKPEKINASIKPSPAKTVLTDKK